MPKPSNVSSEDFYRDRFENAPDMYSSVELSSGAIAACNKTYADRLGYEKAELLERSELDLFASECRPKVQEAYERLLEGQQIDNIEVQMRRSDGSLLDLSLRASAVKQDDGKLYSRTVLRDISELKETERRLREQTERLKRSNRELEQFAYLASHDLQEPLRMVASFTQLLARRYGDKLDERAHGYIDYAVEGAERMQRLINDLLAFSRMGQGDREFESVDLRNVLREVRANLSLRIDETDAEVVVDGLPRSFRGDRTQLLQLFQNLVENALKFAGDATPRVEIEGTREDDVQVITVSDNGIGFENQNAERIFQIFQRLHRRDEYDGTGTGLAIVQKVVDHHGGEISVDATPGVGTTFRIEFPDSAQRRSS